MSMEKELKLYKLVNGQKVLFPSEDKPLFLDTFTYTTQRMGGTPSITASVKYERCLDEEWDGVFAEFNGERYYVKTEPNSSKSNDDARFEHAITLYSERFVLDNTYFIDAVQEDSAIDKYKSNSTKVLFMGDIAEFASRLSDSMAYAGLDYTAVVDEDITTEHKLVSFENKFISEALQEAFNIFEVPYYFVGKVIHFGYTSNAITTPVEYGADEALMTIQKNNANYRIVTRCSGTGSEDNIPYYYPNLSPKGEIAAVASAGNFSVRVVNAEAFSNKVSPSDEIRYKAATFNKEYLSAEYPIFFGQDLTHIQNRLITDTNNPLKAYVMTISNSKGYWQKGSCKAIQSINVTTAGVITIKAEMTSVYFRAGEYLEGKPLDIIDVPTSVQTFRLAVYSKGNDIAPLPYEYFDAEQLKSGISVNIETTGEYYVSFEMVFDDSRKVTSLDHIQYYVYPTVSLEVVSANGGWLLNGEITSLSSLGLVVSGNPKSGDRITQTVGRYIQPSKTLMPPIFRETRGAERFYNAISGIYPTPEIPSEFYDFANEYTEGDPREQVVSFENIKPTIKGMTNASGQPIDKFLEFAWDADDNDDIDPETGDYYHPYFFAKLPKFDGPYGFNLFDSANENGEMAFSMTSGVCGGCEFSIGVGSESQKNIVQVDANGNLERDSKGNVKLGDAQDRQNDTIHNEVWIALKKEENTYPVLMPSLARGLVPTSNDTFVILYINLPQAYITAAEHRLYEEIIKYMKLNNDEKFTFTIGFSRIFFAQNPEFLAQLNENARLLVRYNEREYTFYISTFKYAMTAGDVLPNISVDLVEELTTTGNSLQQRIDAVKQDILASVGGADVLKTGLKYFLRKDIEDVANEKLTFLKGAKFGKYSSGPLGGGGAINVNPDGSTTAEFDFLKIRRKAEFAEITIDELKSVGGTIILSCASMICSAVETLDDRYRCYFQKNGTDGRDVVNQFAVDDLARCQTFATTHTKYYWRQVVGVGDDYIDLSVENADENSDIPSAGDIIVQLGNTTDIDRQSAQILSCYGNDAPSFIMLNGINSFSLTQKDIFGVVFDQHDPQNKQPMLYNYGAMMMGSRDKSGDYITFDPKTGEFFIKAKVQFAAGSSGLGSIPEWNETIQNLQNQIDGVVQTWFSNDVTPEQTGEPLPSKDNPSAVANYPVNTWAEGTASQHLGDLYYSNANKAYRFQKIGDTMVWSEIPDSDITKVLEAAKKASEEAAAAKKAAEDALKGANAANERLSAWASDGKFSPAELTSLADELVFANSETAKISQDLQRYGIDATVFNSAANAYIKMLEDITITATPDKDGCVPVPPTFSTVHQAYYTQRTTSLNAISTKAKEIADKAKDTADQAATDAATALNAAISGVDVEYAQNTSNTEAPKDGWTTVAPKWQSGYYIWQRTKTSYANGKKPTYSAATCISGADGQSGTSVTITSTEVRYAGSASNTTAPTDGWTANPPAVDEGKYLWTRTKVTYSDGTTTTAYSVAKQGQSGNTPTITISSDGYWVINGEKTTTKAEGTEGRTPVITIGDNGNWWIDGVDSGKTAQGKDGVGISGVTEHYGVSKDASTRPTSWEDVIPATYNTTNKYLWNYETIHYTVGNPVDTEPAIIGVYGKDGESGRGITSIVEHYAISRSNTSAPTTGWSDTFVVPTKDEPYLWNYETINYTDGKSEDTNKAIIGMRGADGNSITVKNTSVDYAVSDNVDNIPASSAWGERPTTIGDGKYLWTRTTITYSDDTSTTSYSYARQGTDGSAGVGVKSITELYYMTAKTTKPSKPTEHVTSEADAVETWTKKCPTWIAGCVYYTCSEIEYDDKAGHYAWTDVQIDTNYRSRTFYTDEGEYPEPPYNIGDQWACANGTFQTTSTLLAAYGSTLVADDGVVTAEQVTITIKNELLVCINPKAQGEKFDIADWTPSGGYGKKMDYQYLVDCLPQGSTTDVYGGLVLGNMIGVKNEDGMVVAFMNGLETQSSLKDATYGTLMFASGITNGVANAKKAATQIWSDGTLISTKGKFTNAEVDGKITANTGKIGNFDITSGGWLIATSGSSDWNFELRFSAASFNVESSNVTFESIDYQHTAQTAQGETYVPVVCTYGADFFISAYGSMTSMSARHAVLDISSNVSYASGKTPEFRNIGIRLDVKGASDIYYGSIGECGGNYAIYCDNGMFAGLRPKTVKIVNSTTLTVLDYNVIAEPTANITITFPSSVRVGQTYRIFKPKTVSSRRIVVSTGGKSIRGFGLRYDGVNNLEVSGTPLDASKWGVVEYVFDGTYWNRIIISVYDYYYDPNN